MPANDLTQRIAEMETKELYRILLKEQDTYESDLLDAVKKELDTRGVKLSQVVHQVDIRLNNGPVERSTLQEAVKKLDENMSKWDTWYFKNYFDEHLAIQAAHLFWIVYYFGQADDQTAFAIEEIEIVKDLLQKFLQLEEWQIDEEAMYPLDDWLTFKTSNSQSYIDNLAQKLEKAQIPYLIKNLQAWHFDAIFGSQSGSQPYCILVPDSHIDECNKLISEMEKAADKLYEQLAEAEKQDDLNAQLDIYQKLEDVTINDAVNFFNKGVLLLELNRLDEAIDALIQSITLDLEDGNLESAYESEPTLREILQDHPDNTDILYCLVNVANSRRDFQEAISLYETIVSLNEKDSIAHMNLGQLYYENTDQNELAYRHFKTYLELDPNAEDRKDIEAILTDLEYKW